MFYFHFIHYFKKSSEEQKVEIKKIVYIILRKNYFYIYKYPKGEIFKKCGNDNQMFVNHIRP